MRRFLALAGAGVFASVKAFAAVFGPRELALIAGVGLVGYGAHLVFPPAAFFLPGAILSYVAIAGLR